MDSFRDRMQAGQLLAQQLEAYASHQEVIVLALPRGGVPVGYAIASRLECPLDILLVAKLGVPGHEDIALGAVSSRGVCVLRPETIALMDISPEAIESMAQRELNELKRREAAYRAIRPTQELKGRLVIIADDGLVSGATMLAAVRTLRHENPARIIVAVPVASADSISELRTEVEDVTCLMVPDWLTSVDQWYEDARPVDDTQVMAYLRDASQWRFPEAAATQVASHAQATLSATAPTARPF